jgi:hypothetical protein
MMNSDDSSEGSGHDRSVSNDFHSSEDSSRRPPSDVPSSSEEGIQTDEDDASKTSAGGGGGGGGEEDEDADADADADEDEDDSEDEDEDLDLDLDEDDAAAAAAGADIPHYSIQDVLDMTRKNERLFTVFNPSAGETSGSIYLKQEIWRKYGIEDRDFGMILIVVDYDKPGEGNTTVKEKGRGANWTPRKFGIAHDDLLKQMVKSDSGLSFDGFTISVRNYFSTSTKKKKEGKEGIKQFIVEKLSEQQLIDLRCVFRNGKGHKEVSGYLKFKLLKACNTNSTDDFVKFCIENIDLINRIIRKFRIKISMNADGKAICTLIVPSTKCKLYIDIDDDISSSSSSFFFSSHQLKLSIPFRRL